MAELNFDANDYQPRAGFDAVPTGRYRVQIIDSDIHENKKGTGDLMELELEILEEGEFQGQRAWERLNINNKSAKASQIAREKLSLICHCVGHLQVGKTEELHERPFLADLIFQPARTENGSDYGPSNKVGKCYPDDERGGGGPKTAVVDEDEPKAKTTAQTHGQTQAQAGKSAGGTKAAPGRLGAAGGPAGGGAAPWRQPRA